MTQATRPTLPLRLVSMRLPETMDWIRRSRSDPSAAQNVLRLTPGMVSDIAIELENSGDRPIHWSLEMTGNFPVAWCVPASNSNTVSGASGTGQLGASAINETGAVDPTSEARPHYRQTGTIDGNQSLYASIRLQVPHDFFEAQAALAQQPTLELDYGGEIFLFAHFPSEHNLSGQGQRLAGYQYLRLEVRPVSDYMALLPEIFQSEDFMLRFLSLFEQTFDPSLQMLAMLQAYLDPLTAPRAMLPFLAKWVAWEMEPRWSLKQQRRLIRYAIELYRWRGTRRGLRYYLHLYTDLPLDDDLPEAEKHISITDSTQEAFVFGQARFGESVALEGRPPSAFGGGQPFHFRVVLRPEGADPIDEALIRRVIEQVKPAFCTYELAIAPRIASQAVPETAPATESQPSR